MAPHEDDELQQAAAILASVTIAKARVMASYSRNLVRLLNLKARARVLPGDSSHGGGTTPKNR